ncbi:MAG TPA: hypothetical protein VGB53_16270 [Rubricoccaceae bacterium]|jgi:hypothetical protein
MTPRFFRAAGTLAVALVVLAGCDSAAPESSATAVTANSELPPAPFANISGCYTGNFGANDFGTYYSTTFNSSTATRYLRLTAQATGTAGDYLIVGSINVNGQSYSYEAYPGDPVTVRVNTVAAGSPLTVTAGRGFFTGGGGGGTYNGVVKFSLKTTQRFIDPCIPAEES